MRSSTIPSRALVLATALLAASCTVPIDPNMTIDENNQVDFTEYAGVSINGTVSKNGGPAEPQKLDLAQLAVALYTQCQDRFEEEGEQVLVGYCSGGGASGLSDCGWRFCMSMMYNCLSNELMTLAASTGPIEFDTEIMSYSADRSNDEIIFTINEDEGRIKDPVTGAFIRFAYSLPPLTDKQKTLIYVAARAAAREAGRRLTGIAMEPVPTGEVGLYPTCIDEMKAQQQDEEQVGGLTVLGYFVHGLGESMALLSEASTKAATNQAHVAAATLGSQPDYAAAQAEAWENKVNSFSSAVLGLTGGEVEQPIVTGCPTDPSSPTQRRAVDLLRAARVASIFDVSATDSQVADEANEALRLDIEDPTPTSQETFLQQRGITLADIALARRYLKDEQIALDRMHLPDLSAVPENNPNAPERVYGLSSRALQHPAAFHLARATTFSPISNMGDNYMRLGAVQALDAMRHSANELLKRAAREELDTGVPLLTADQRTALARASLAASQQVGTQRIWFTSTEASDNLDLPPYSMTLDVHGAKETDHYFLVAGNEGYRCAVEGSIDGAPCSVGEYVVPVSSVFTPADPEVRGPQDAIATFDLTGAGLPPGTELHLINGSAEPSKKYMGGLRVQDNAQIIAPVITGYGMALAIEQFTTREDGQCGLSEDPCGDLGLPRDYSPPLENELTQAGGDPSVEDNWRHFLGLARAASEEADRLGEQLVQSGLDMDVKADGARRALEEICGDVVNLPDVDTSTCSMSGGVNPACDVVSKHIQHDDPGLANCLSTDLGGKLERGPVSLGAKLCFFEWSESGLCRCPEGAGNCANAKCPLKASENASGPGDCQAAYGNPSWQTDLLSAHPDSKDTVQFKLVDNSLNIFQSTDRGDYSLSWETAQEQLDELEQNITDPTMLADAQAFHIWFSNWLSRPTNQWINLNTLKVLARSLKLDVDFLHHYTLSLGGSVVATTRTTDPGNECPEIAPWHGITYRLRCVRSLTDPFGNYPLAAPEQYQDAWLAQELDLSSGFASIRKEWGSRVRMHLTQLGGLTGEVRNIQASYLEALRDDPDNLVFLGDVSSGLLIKQLPPEEGFAEPRTCLYEGAFTDPSSGLAALFQEQVIRDDPEIALCREYHHPILQDDIYSYYRREFPLDFRMGSGDVNLFELWHDDLEGFLIGAYPTGNRWRLLSERNESDTIGIYGESNPDDGGRTKLRLVPEVCSSFSGCFAFTEDLASLSRLEFVKLLRFAAYMLTRSSGASIGCSIENAAAEMPTISDVEDLRLVRDHVNCVANAIDQIGERILVPNLPLILASGYQQTGVDGYYPGYQGENLKVILALEADLQKFGTAAKGVQDVLRRVSGHVETLYLITKKHGIQRKINALNTAVSVLSAALQAVSVMGSPTEWFTGAAGVSAVGYAAIGAMQAAIGGLQDELLDIEEEQAFNDAMLAIGDRMSDLRGLYNDIFKAFESIQANLTTLDQLQNKAAMAFADMLFLDSDTAGHVLNVNTVMRRRNNTLRERYEAAFKRAKKLAFIARRAIEMRLGVNMSKMTDSMTLVPPPSTWVDGLCAMQGFDYQRLRTADPENPAFDPALMESDSYANWYIGDYVKRLEDFVESYNFDFPFTDEHDVAVVSLRDDIMGLKTTCEVESYNLLYHAGEVGLSTQVEVNGASETRGWVQVCFVAGDSCLSAQPEPSVEVPPHGSGGSSSAMRLRDPVFESITVPGVGTYASRGAGWANTGYFKQVVTGVVPGEYMVSWYDQQPPADPTAPAPPAYRVEVYDVGVDPALVVAPAFVGLPTAGQWGRPAPIRFEVTATTDLEVRIYPSDSTGDATSYGSDPSSVVFGDVLLWGAQLEWVHPSRCGTSGCRFGTDLPDPLGIQVTTGTRQVMEPACRDLEGTQMQAAFTRGCVCLDEKNGICPENAQPSDYRRCYYEYGFPISLDAIEQGTLIPSNNVAINNFNYRQEAFAVNIVGTNVVDCTQQWSTPTCYTNAFVPYTLEHQGSDMPVRNHSRETELFTLHTGRIEHGKGLTAEVVLTNPLTGTHTQLLTEYWKDGLRGRPFQGNYKVRIWETPDLDWRKVEDIQLVYKYRYWTQMTGN